VLERPCPDCGFDSTALRRREFAGLTRRYTNALVAALDRPGSGDRRTPDVWSDHEYACHVRDVCTVFFGRLTVMIAEDDPLFANWDQDATALEQRYWRQDPASVRRQLLDAADRMANRWAQVREDEWTRPGRRSNGSTFTVDSLGRYFLHDLAHHAWDVRAS
jgi:hypothetical protein